MKKIKKLFLAFIGLFAFALPLTLSNNVSINSLNALQEVEPAPEKLYTVKLLPSDVKEVANPSGMVTYEKAIERTEYKCQFSLKGIRYCTRTEAPTEYLEMKSSPEGYISIGENSNLFIYSIKVDSLVAGAKVYLSYTVADEIKPWKDSLFLTGGTKCILKGVDKQILKINQISNNAYYDFTSITLEYYERPKEPSVTIEPDPDNKGLYVREDVIYNYVLNDFPDGEYKVTASVKDENGKLVVENATMLPNGTKGQILFNVPGNAGTKKLLISVVSKDKSFDKTFTFDIVLELKTMRNVIYDWGNEYLSMNTIDPDHVAGKPGENTCLAKYDGAKNALFDLEVSYPGLVKYFKDFNDPADKDVSDIKARYLAWASANHDETPFVKVLPYGAVDVPSALNDTTLIIISSLVVLLVGTLGVVLIKRRRELD